MLDDDLSGKVSRDEVCDYFKKLVDGLNCEGPEADVEAGFGGEQEMQVLNK